MKRDVLTLGLRSMLHMLNDPQSPGLLLPGAGNQATQVKSLPSPSVWQSQSHDFDEIAYVAEGDCVMVFGETGYRAQAGSICIVPPGSVHYEAPSDPTDAYKVIWLGLTSSRIVAHETAYSTSTRRLEKTAAGGAWVSNDLKPLLNAVYHEMQKQRMMSTLVIKGYVMAIIGLLLRNAKQQETTPPLLAHPDPIVQRTAAYIERHYANPGLTVTSMAAHVALSSKYFIGYMHREAGCTPYRYLLQVRMNKACRYLITTEWPVVQISEAVGFTSPYHFSATFKRFSGVSPTQYRTACRSGFSPVDQR